MIRETLNPPGPEGSSWSDWADDLDASRRLGLRCLEMGASGVSMAMAESAWALNPNGAVHGGLVFAAADHCMGVAAYAAQAAGRGAATVSLTVNYHAPAMLPVTFEATVARRTRTVTFVELTATGGDGRTCTRATGVWATPASAR